MAKGKNFRVEVKVAGFWGWQGEYSSRREMVEKLGIAISPKFIEGRVRYGTYTNIEGTNYRVARLF